MYPAASALKRNRWDWTASARAASAFALGLAIILYLALTLVQAQRRLWHDELYTLYIGTAPTLSQLWQDMAVDFHPPLEYLAVRISAALFGTGSYAIRLPSILAFLAGSLCLCKFVASRLSFWYGLLAMLVLWASPAFYYATEARPYALVICFTGLTLLFWRRAIEPQRGVRQLWLLAAAVSGLMLSHMLAPFYITPFCLAELIRAFRRRRFDRRIWTALLLPCAIPFLYLGLVQRFGTYTFPPVFQASLRKIGETYYGSLKLEAIPLLLGLGLALMTVTRNLPEKNQTPMRRLDSVEVTLIAGFLALPAIVNLALMGLHAAFFDRYGLPVEFGYALAVAFFLAHQTNRSLQAAIAATSVLLLFVCAFNFGPGLRRSVWGQREDARMEQSLERVRPELPLVAASGLTFLEMDHYGDPATIARLYYLTDRKLAVRYANATLFETMPILKREFPIRAHVVSFDRFTTEHKSFLVLGTPEYPEDWLLRALLDRRATVEYLGSYPGPYKDTQLYHVAIGY